MDEWLGSLESQNEKRKRARVRKTCYLCVCVWRLASFTWNWSLGSANIMPALRFNMCRGRGKKKEREK